MNYQRLFPLAITIILILSGCSQKKEAVPETKPVEKQEVEIQKEVVIATDTLAYQQKSLALANGDTTGHWPIKSNIYPLDGAILPFKRIVAYYGNLYSKKMGALGEYAPKEMWERLNAEVAAWENADPTTPVQPAIHYIAVVAQGIPMSDGTYCKRMPESQIDSALAIAKMGNAIVFLDIQVALSNLKNEVPLLEKYLKMPQVHLGIDPEFSMKDGSIPGKKIGSYDAEDINYCSNYLSNLVKEHNLTPKILVVHRFTQGMVKNHKNIKLHPEVQIVMHMDGWGEPVLKRSTYKLYIYKEPVQFTGFKLFYKNDLKKAPHVLMTPQDLLKLKPQPIYIQYQ
jgi:hypothetical protein